MRECYSLVLKQDKKFMYYIRKSEGSWSIRNNTTGVSRQLTEEEVKALLQEFPNLRNSTTVTYFRNRVNSITNLP